MSAAVVISTFRKTGDFSYSVIKNSPYVSGSCHDLRHYRQKYIYAFVLLASQCESGKKKKKKSVVNITKTRLFKYIENFTPKN